jgi:hypothetical protein
MTTEVAVEKKEMEIARRDEAISAKLALATNKIVRKSV